MKLEDWVKLPQAVYLAACDCGKAVMVTATGHSQPEGGIKVDCIECVQKNGISSHYVELHPEKAEKLKTLLHCRLCDKATTQLCGGCPSGKNVYCDDLFGHETPGLCDTCGGWSDSC